MSSRGSPEKNAELSLLFLYESRPGQHPGEPTLVRAVTGYRRPPLRTGANDSSSPALATSLAAPRTAGATKKLNRNGVRFWTDCGRSRVLGSRVGEWAFDATTTLGPPQRQSRCSMMTAPVRRAVPGVSTKK